MCAVMMAHVWVNTRFISTVPGRLEALVMQSDLHGYMQFMGQSILFRLVSTLLRVLQVHLQSTVSILWRQRIARAVTERYVMNNNFYFIRHTDKRVLDAESRLTQDVDELGQLLSQQVQQLLRPVFDALYCSFLLVQVRLCTIQHPHETKCVMTMYVCVR